MRLHLILVTGLESLRHHKLFHRILVIKNLADLLASILYCRWRVLCEQNRIKRFLENLSCNRREITPNQSKTLHVNLALFFRILILDCRIPLFGVQNVRVIDLLKLQIVGRPILLCNLTCQPLCNLKVVIDVFLVLPLRKLHLYHDTISIAVYDFRTREKLNCPTRCHINHVATSCRD
ncbi:hypothetical protein FR483_n024R [Paramecium bursaria Chlorella virus FR483]|uniref:Uncharacterized protein n024R n=1 Tax=Paramecium bursaria Chlorella virus FR483 TaxID=399781 RepID=A7J678_PBCVF|nr:hypothetical protein FR483_n024R [Paramecium bursaria Chlorella virus FR483]ABT15309.1 hypothetical protein FR483_n024R [Paramecium bursaria Chlorella virus FR483]